MGYRLHLISEQREALLTGLSIAAACDEGRVEAIRPLLPKGNVLDDKAVDRTLQDLQAVFQSGAEASVTPGHLIPLIESDRDLPDARHLLVLIEAIEFGNRLGMGQVAIAFERYRHLQWQRHWASGTDPKALQRCCERIDRVLGGAASFSATCLVTRRLYEIGKVCRKAHAEYVGAPALSVDRDGLIVRYTSDEAPAISVRAIVASVA